VSPGYEAREAILKALGTGNAGGAAALVAIYAPEDPVALRAVRCCLRLQRLYDVRVSWGRSNSAAHFGLVDAIRRTEPLAEDARTALRNQWPMPSPNSDTVLF